MKTNPKLAYSLIETSIVLVIVAILVAAVTQGSVLVTKVKLNNARTLTQSSPVSSTPNLGLWLETTNESSFKTEYSNNAPLAGSSGSSVWYDSNAQLAKQNNALSTSNSPYSSNPLYVEKGINSLPALSFNGTSQYLDFTNPAILAATSYTIFVVEQPTKAASGYNYFLASKSACSANECFSMGHNFTSGYSIDLSHKTNLIATTSTEISGLTYKTNIPILHSGIFSLTTGRKYFYNGIAGKSDSVTSALIGNTSMSIGKGYTAGYYQGLIGEIIFFTRALTKAERWAIEQYLGHKWGISVTQSS